MALTRPTAKTKAAFDATKSETFYFNVEGGDLVTGNKITIVDQVTGNTVYTTPSEHIGRLVYNRTIPSNLLPPPQGSGLVNGKYYYYYFNTFNANGDMSVNSNPVPFYCYTTPVIEFTNLPPQGEYIETSNFIFNMTYSQAEGELMDYLIVTIYDANHREYIKSDKILSNSSNNYAFSVLGLANGEYSIKAECVTINDTVVYSSEEQFVVRTIVPKIYSRFSAEPKCDKGYVEITSTLSDIEGICNEDPIEYVEPSSIALLPRQHWVEWDEGFRIPSVFTLGVWGKIGENYQRKNNQEFRSEIVRMFNDRGDSIVINISCEIPSGETDPKHCFEVNVFSGGSLVGWGRTNYISLLNPNDDYVFIVQKNGINWNLMAKNLTEHTFDFVWNRVNEVGYGQTMASVLWKGSTYDMGSTAVNNFASVLDSIFPMTHVKLSNGVYDHIDVSKNVTRTIEDYTEPLEWDYDTIIDCNFENNINAGNTDDIISELAYIRVKRRVKGTSKWITLKEVDCETEGTSFVWHDVTPPHGITQEYAIVPVASDKSEGDYLIIEVTPHWMFNFITIGDKTFPIYADVRYGTVTNNRKFGVLEPIQSKYPIIVKNSELGYLSGTITAKFLGNGYLETRQINRLEVTKEIQEFQKYMDLGYSICLKDFNGWSLLCKPTSGDTASFISEFGNGLADVAFNWVEQGKYDNQDDLYYLGFIDINI
jgi:hypothetical protein